MPIGILRATRNLPDQISYIPKAGCSARQITIVRSTTVLGESNVKPIVMRDPDLWNDYSSVIAAVVSAKSRDWTSPQTAGTRVTNGALKISNESWSDIRGRKYQNTEMVGAMVAKLSYADATDYVVTAAPNMLFASNTSSYKDHTAGDNKGTQIHAEMTMGAQLMALVTAMRDAPETAQGAARPRPGLSAGALLIDADMFIEKGSMCDGCLGTWNRLIRDYPASTYRIA